MRTGGKILIDQLVIQGCRTLFTVPGESFLAALDALFDEGPIRTIVCRHEGGAAMMAEACGKLTGEPGVAFVTRAAGAANAVSG
ncbi:MAG: thiamine pyrophosphate-binding protein, partial [Hyphomicrobiaceae bacterium]|nr:thiamine pyrophosphate-binding protein [Hyphomicrobiaceae bacterium]